MSGRARAIDFERVELRLQRLLHITRYARARARDQRRIPDRRAVFFQNTVDRFVAPRFDGGKRLACARILCRDAVLKAQRIRTPRFDRRARAFDLIKQCFDALHDFTRRLGPRRSARFGPGFFEIGQTGYRMIKLGHTLRHFLRQRSETVVRSFPSAFERAQHFERRPLRHNLGVLAQTHVDLAREYRQLDSNLARGVIGAGAGFDIAQGRCGHLRLHGGLRQRNRRGRGGLGCVRRLPVHGCVNRLGGTCRRLLGARERG